MKFVEFILRILKLQVTIVHLCLSLFCTDTFDLDFIFDLEN